jgi:hypothetical protein
MLTTSSVATMAANPSTTIAELATTTSDPATLGLVTAQALADAFAEEDWAAVRTISPSNPYTDAELELGYEGLRAATLFLGGATVIDESTTALYILQVAYETRPAGDQTSLYCVRWDYDIDRNTIVQQAGEFIRTDPGLVPAGDAARGASACHRFDLQVVPPGGPVPTPTVMAPPVPVNGFDAATCTFKGIPLWGSFSRTVLPIGADIRVYVLSRDQAADLGVRFVMSSMGATSCGLWSEAMISAGADFTVYFASSSAGADLLIYDVGPFGTPGAR